MHQRASNVLVHELDCADAYRDQQEGLEQLEHPDEDQKER
jgi:hypothetical protein